MLIFLYKECSLMNYKCIILFNNLLLSVGAFHDSAKNLIKCGFSSGNLMVQGEGYMVNVTSVPSQTPITLDELLKMSEVERCHSETKCLYT